MEEISHPAMAAVWAAKNAHTWGEYAARRYAERRGASARMYEVARSFERRRRAKRT